MARIPRRHLVAQGTVNHCTWRGHNFMYCLESTAAKLRFLTLLAEYRAEHGIEIYSYSVMNSHPHVQCRSRLGQAAFSRFWKIVNQRFSRWYNRAHSRRGQVVMERMTSGLVQDSDHQLKVMRYGDSNPVRAGIVKSPKQWPWSSYRHYAFGEVNPLITDAPAYLELGSTKAERRRAYVHLFARSLTERPDAARRALVISPFIGRPDWVTSRLLAIASPPEPS